MTETALDKSQAQTDAACDVARDAIGLLEKVITQRDEAIEVLEEIAKGEGRYSRDPLTHAENCIEDMKNLARDFLQKGRSNA